MGKKLVILLGVIGLIILGAVLVYFSITGSKTIEAQIHIEKGDVLVNGNIIKSDMYLEEEDTVETKENGLASVILYESVVVSLEPNTKISISELNAKNPKINQERGETWNKFTKMAGVEGYEIKDGNTVASVRGTLFKLGNRRIVGVEGKVSYLLDGKSYALEGLKVVEEIDGKVIERELNAQEKAEIVEIQKRIVEELRELRKKEIEKHPKIFNMIKKKFDLSDEKVNIAFEKADRGQLDINELASKSPVNIKSIDKIVEITQKIKEINSLLNTSN